jgi:biopolymer transport protein ExbB
MSLLLDPLQHIQDLLDAGGHVLWAILLVSLLLWTLIIERYLYFGVAHPRYLSAIAQRWQSGTPGNAWEAGKIRQALVAEVSLRLSRYLALIRTLVSICPLLGLLGTVVGMIHVFDVMALMGSGNARAMAAGVSMATIPTMAGMVVALSGLFFSNHLQQRAALEALKADRLLRKRDL